MLAGGFTAESGLAAANQYKNTLVAYGRSYISNPDLPRRIRDGIPFAPYNRETFYLKGPTQAKGYIDYPAADEASATDKAKF